MICPVQQKLQCQEVFVREFEFEANVNSFNLFNLFHFIFLNIIFVFIFGCAGSLLLCRQAFLQLWRVGSYSAVAGFWLRSTASGRARFRHQSMWPLPRSGLKHLHWSLALVGGFCTTELPGKLYSILFLRSVLEF